MADISSVEQTLLSFMLAAIYPLGITQPSVTGTLIRLYRGWPNPAALSADLAAGVVNVTIMADNDSGQTTTRYMPTWTTAATQPGVSMTCTGSIVNIGGTPALGDLAGILVDGQAYSYRIQSGDNPETVAASLGLMIQKPAPALVQGSQITIYGSTRISVRTRSDSVATQESRRQEKDVRVVCWCSTPDIRDQIATTIDTQVNTIRFLTLPDNSDMRIIYKNTASYDQAQNALLYRRDLIYTVDYPTITSSLQPVLLFGDAAINGSPNYG